jgi:hypothetical protein
LEEGKSFEDLDPQANEAVGIVLGIMRGTIRGRHLSTRLNAALAVLYQYRGRPAQKTELEAGDKLVDLINRSMELEERKIPQSLTPAVPKRLDPALVEDEPIEVEVVNE